MLADASRKPRPFDIVLILNFSRFFRDDFDLERYRRKLAADGIDLESVTQPIASGPSGKLTRGITALFDAYASDVNAEQVKMAMTGNAARGFWNGSVPPFGYESFTVQRMGTKEKKQLRVVEEEAIIVRLIYDLCLEQCGNYGESSLLAISKELNRRALRIRGRSFSISVVRMILHRQTYTGVHYYNQRDRRTRKLRRREDWVAFSVPPIVTSEQFGKVQERLAKRDPKVTPPLTVSGRSLTAGLVKCGVEGCGAGMVLRSGLSSKPRYLICSKRKKTEVTACSLNAINMSVLDELVIEFLAQRILAPNRLSALLDSVVGRSDTALNNCRNALWNRRLQHSKVKGSKMRLLEWIGRTQTIVDDSEVKETFDDLAAQLSTLSAEISHLEH